MLFLIQFSADISEQISCMNSTILNNGPPLNVCVLFIFSIKLCSFMMVPYMALNRHGIESRLEELLHFTSFPPQPPRMETIKFYSLHPNTQKQQEKITEKNSTIMERECPGSVLGS